MMDRNFPLLFFLAKKCGLNNSCETSTTELAAFLECSQQTVSRKLREIEKQGLIQRMVSSTGTQVHLTGKAEEFFKNHMSEVEGLFSKKCDDLSVKGIVESGLGEGKYYMSLPQYKKQFKQKLGFTPFPGTLNIRVNEFALEEFLKTATPVIVDGFETNRRTFGRIECFKICVDKYKALALIRPHRSSHQPGVAEIISPDFLRTKFGLDDGDEITFNVHSDN